MVKKDKKKSKHLDDKNRIIELTESLQRLQAEYENYKKRIEKQTEDFVKYTNSDFIAKILPIIDHFDLALKNQKEPEKFRQGVQLIYTELMSLLKHEGLEKINAQNKQFDPHLHEAMLAKKSNKETGTILEVLQEGYKLKDRIIRHSKVKISK